MLLKNDAAAFEQSLPPSSNSRALDDYAAGLDLIPMQASLVNKDGDILLTNKAWQQFEHDNSSSPCGNKQNYFDVCSGVDGSDKDHADAVFEGLRMVLSGTLTSFEHVYPCHSPTQKRWYKAYITPNAHGALICHSDVTTEALKGTPLNQSDLLINRLNVLKAHLSGIAALDYVIQSEDLSGLSQFSTKILKIAEVSAHRINTEIQNVLTYLKSGTTGEFKDEESYHILEPLINELIDKAQAQLPDRNITVIVNNNVQGLTILANKDDIAGTISYFLENALKVTKEGGTVSVSLDISPAKSLEISIQDQGDGMQESELFDLMWQKMPDANSKDVSPKLNDVHRVNQSIRRLDGMLDAKTAPGQGVRFRILLPAWRIMKD